MAARKLHVLGARERIGGSAGAGAVAEAVVQNGNGVCVQPAVGTTYESRMASPIMQPFPLASRYGGTKHDSLRPAAAALQSTWIQRLRPASPDVPCGELGQQVARVWRDPQPALWSSKTPLLLAGPSKEPLHDPVPMEESQAHHEADGDGDMRLMVREEVGSSKALAKNTEFADKGKGRIQSEDHTAREMTAEQRRNDNGRTAQAQQFKLPVFSSCSKGFVAVEGSSRRQGVISPQEGKNIMSTPSSQSPNTNGESGALMTGFGPLRVVLKASMGNTLNKTVGSSSKLKGRLMEGLEVADDSRAGNHYMAGLDRSRAETAGGPQVRMTSVQRGSSTQVKMSSPDPTMEIHGRHVVRPGELFGGGIYPRLQSAGHGSDSGRPFMLHQSQVPGKDKMFGYVGFSNVNSSGGILAMGEDDPMEQSMKGWYPAFSAVGNGVDRTGKGIAANHSFGPILAEEDPIHCDQHREGKYHNRENPETFGKHGYIAYGLEARKGKEVVSVDKCCADVGCSQQQASHISPPFAPYQSPTHISYDKQPFPFSFVRNPSRKVEEEAPIGNDVGDASQGRPEQTSSSAPLCGPPKPRQGGMEDTSRNPPWSSLFAAYKVPNQPGEPPQSNSSTGTLPVDGRTRLQEGQNPGNHFSRANDNQDNESGGSARCGTHPGASSAEARSLFDNQSSHFSSSPWPVADGRNPTDDAGSAFHSQASVTPSLHVTSVGQVPNTHSRRQGNSRQRCEVGGMDGTRDVSHKRARSREHSESLSLGLRIPSGGVEGSRGQPSTYEEIHVRGLVKNSRLPTMPSISGLKDDTSGSSPPSLPLGCNNSSDFCSPAFPSGSVEDRGKSKAVHLRTADLDSDTDTLQLGKIQQGMTSKLGGSVPKREHGEAEGHIGLGLRRDPRESVARLRKDVEMQEAMPMVGEAFPEVGGKMARPNETADLGQKQSRLRSSDDVVGGVAASGPSKRSRHHANQSSWDFQGGRPSGVQPKEQGKGVGTDRPSTWLARWLPAGSKISGAGMNSQTAGKPKHGHRNGFVPGYPADGRVNGAGGFSGDGAVPWSRAGGHVRRTDENGSDQLNNARELSTKKAVFGLPPFPTPSAAAMALVGTAARKLGPLPSQRKGPIAMWPSVQLETTLTPEPKKSVRSTELPTYVEPS